MAQHISLFIFFCILPNGTSCSTTCNSNTFAISSICYIVKVPYVMEISQQFWKFKVRKYSTDKYAYHNVWMVDVCKVAVKQMKHLTTQRPTTHADKVSQSESYWQVRTCHLLLNHQEMTLARSGYQSNPKSMSTKMHYSTMCKPLIWRSCLHYHSKQYVLFCGVPRRWLSLYWDKIYCKRGEACTSDCFVWWNNSLCLLGPILMANKTRCLQTWLKLLWFQIPRTDENECSQLQVTSVCFSLSSSK
jgi:hypothetical protein